MKNNQLKKWLLWIWVLAASGFCFSFLQFEPSNLGVDNQVFIIRWQPVAAQPLITEQAIENPLAILKVYSKKNIASVQSLLAITDELCYKGFQLPRNYELISLGGKPAVLMEFCPGHHAFDPTYEELREITRSLASFHSTVLNTKLERKVLNRQTLFHFLNLCPSLTKRNFFLQLIESLDMNYLDHLPKGLVHGDFSPSNILLKNGRISAVLDFDHIGFSELLADIARAQIFFAFEGEVFSLPKCLQFIELYESFRPLTKEEKQGFWTQLTAHLIKMYLETYYYVEEKKAVDREIFSKERRFQSPEALFRKLSSYLSVIKNPKLFHLPADGNKNFASMSDYDKPFPTKNLNGFASREKAGHGFSKQTLKPSGSYPML